MILSALQQTPSPKLLIGLLLNVLFIQISVVDAWVPTSTSILSPASSRKIRTQSIEAASLPSSQRSFQTALNVFETKEKTPSSSPSSTSASASTSDDSSPEETTKSFGLEAGLFQSLKKNDGGQSAKDLLAKYGVAYLATSIPLALVSFTLCYILIDSGVDVASLLSNVGIEVSESGERVGTFALAYAAHKAASPIRFPPTVLLTPIVARMIGKEPEGEGEAE